MEGPVAQGELLVSCGISAAVFALCSLGVLFRHRTVAVWWFVLTGAATGVMTNVVTVLVWRAIEPGFRHAVPIDLLPLFVLPLVFGAVAGVTFYLTSLRRMPI